MSLQTSPLRTTVRRRLKAFHRNLRGARMIAGAFASTDHPLLAHIIPVRRCNLACEYCNEYDDFSKPVPTETMFQRVDKLAALGPRLSPSAAASLCSIPNSIRLLPAFVNAA